MARLRVASAALMLALAGGCGREERTPVFPVRGQVVYAGKPAVRARVAFHRLDATGTQSERPNALVAEDGIFRLSTRRAYDGAPAGEYAVTITWPSPSKKEDGFDAGPDVFNNRYADPKTTPFRVRVKEGENELGPFVVN
jgi:hypothetical protein